MSFFSKIKKFRIKKYKNTHLLQKKGLFYWHDFTDVHENYIFLSKNYTVSINMAKQYLALNEGVPENFLNKDWILIK